MENRFEMRWPEDHFLMLESVVFSIVLQQELETNFIHDEWNARKEHVLCPYPAKYMITLGYSAPLR